MKQQVLETLQINPDQTIFVKFVDGVEGTINFSSSFFNGSFHKPLKDPRFFLQACEDEMNMIMWPNGFGISSHEIHDCLVKYGVVWVS